MDPDPEQISKTATGRLVDVGMFENIQVSNHHIHATIKFGC